MFLSVSELPGIEDPSKVLREIRKEVKELGKFPGDDFIKREFFVGKDDDDTYQDIHVLVLIRNIEEIEKITIQVTYFQPSEKDPTVKYAKDMRNIEYALLHNEIVILKSDYGEKERRKFLPQVLRAIRGKKKLLKKKVRQLIDGGGITVPGARLYDNDGHWFWEGEGVSPDFEVWDDPNILVQGRDPQIEKVGEEVLKLLEANPLKMTPAPPFEDRTAKGLKIKK